MHPTNDKDAQLNRQFAFGTDLNKILPDLLKLRMEAEKPDIKFSQHTHGSLAVNYALDQYFYEKVNEIEKYQYSLKG